MDRDQRGVDGGVLGTSSKTEEHGGLMDVGQDTFHSKIESECHVYVVCK